MTFICQTSSSRLRWEVTLNDRRVSSVSHSFLTSSQTLHFITTILNDEIPLNFELVSKSMGILNSTLTIQTTAALNNSEIECDGTTAELYMFKLAGPFINIMYSGI